MRPRGPVSPVLFVLPSLLGLGSGCANNVDVSGLDGFGRVKSAAWLAMEYEDGHFAHKLVLSGERDVCDSSKALLEGALELQDQLEPYYDYSAEGYAGEEACEAYVDVYGQLAELGRARYPAGSWELELWTRDYESFPELRSYETEAEDDADQIYGRAWIQPEYTDWDLLADTVADTDCSVEGDWYEDYGSAHDTWVDHYEQVNGERVEWGGWDLEHGELLVKGVEPEDSIRGVFDGDLVGLADTQEDGTIKGKLKAEYCHVDLTSIFHTHLIEQPDE